MVEVKYNNAVIASLEAGQTATLQCNGKKMVGDVKVTAPEVADNPLPIEVETEIQMNTLLLLEETEAGAVYKYTGATTARYEKDAFYLVEIVPISFSINGKTYQAEEGMTWAQWCDSKYNTDGWYIKDATAPVDSTGQNQIHNPDYNDTYGMQSGYYVIYATAYDTKPYGSVGGAG